MVQGFLFALVALVAGCAVAPPANTDAVRTFAFVDVTLIATYGAPHRTHQTVIVRDDRIVAIGRARSTHPPRGATIVAGRGRVLAPGLADMHAHIFEPNDGVLFLANGVTTVRNMAGRADTDALAARIGSGAAPGPYIYSSGPIIDGAWGAAPPRTADDVRRLVDETAGHGYIAAKLYENLTPALFAAGVAEARARGLQVYAHVPLSMSVRDVLSLHIDSIEHLTGFDRTLAPNSHSDWDQERWTQIDPALIAPLARDVAASGVWNAATLVTWLAAERGFADIEAAERAPLYRYATPRLRQHWRNIYNQVRQEHDPARAWALAQQGHRARLTVVRALHDAGAPLLIGTDATQPFLYPGFSLQDELAFHRDAGIPTADVLRAASAGAARFLHRDSEFGVIAAGARADLLLLDADPEADLTTLRSPVGVMAAGRWYDAATLHRMLDDVAARNAVAIP